MFGNHFLNFIKVIKYRDIVDNRDNCTSEYRDIIQYIIAHP